MTYINTWDYKEGDLIEVEKLGWPPMIGFIIRFVDLSPGVSRRYWEWQGTTGQTQFFFEVKSPLQEDFKIKVLARA